MNSLLKNKVIVKILKNIGIKSTEAADAFLFPSYDQLHDPALLNDINKAADRLLKARDTETIFIHGDYDVDGITATYILTKGLRALGFKVIPFIPNRHLDGYDIRSKSVDLALEKGCSLILTCDCGTSALDTVTYANSKGIDVIITDHHLPKSSLPAAVAIVNPHLGSYPFEDLCGAVVALKVIQYISRKINLDFEELALDKFIDVAALGIIADVVPLLDENRVLAKFGLRKMRKTSCKGLAAILNAIKLEGNLSAHDVAFKVAPRLNAVGRLDAASKALDLLLTSNEEEAKELAKTLDKFNRTRQETQADILMQAEFLINSQQLDKNPVIICYGTNWNSGVGGIVAGKIADKYKKPCIVMNLNDEGILHGSARSVEGFHLVNNLDKVKEYLISYGGHSLAAGMSVAKRNFSEFKRTLFERCDPIPEFAEKDSFIEIDMKDVNLSLAMSLLKFEPFGEKNEKPVFKTKVRVSSKAIMGKLQAHLRLDLIDPDSDYSDVISGVAWRHAFDWGMLVDEGDVIYVTYTLEVNEYNGNVSPQMMIQSLELLSES